MSDDTAAAAGDLVATEPAKPVVPRFGIPIDPNNVPVQTINRISTLDYFGSVIAMTLSTDRVGFDENGNVKPEMIVAARLRFDLEMAKIIRDALDRQIAVLTAPKDVQPN